MYCEGGRLYFSTEGLFLREDEGRPRNRDNFLAPYFLDAYVEICGWVVSVGERMCMNEVNFFVNAMEGVGSIESEGVIC